MRAQDKLLKQIQDLKNEKRNADSAWAEERSQLAAQFAAKQDQFQKEREDLQSALKARDCANVPRVVLPLGTL